MIIDIIKRILLPKYTITAGEPYDSDYLTPRDIWVLFIGNDSNLDYNEVIRMFPDHIIANPLTVYTPISKQEMIDTLQQYIDEYSDSNGIVDLSGMTLEDGTDHQSFIETIEDWFYNSGKKVKYPDGTIVQL